MLHKLQSSFLNGIYNIDAENAAFPFICETQDKNLNIKTAHQQISIYRSSIFGGLKKALAETYPVTKTLVGDEFFNAMLGQYIKSYPCRVQDLNDYGEELPDFIDKLKQARSVPYLADMAQLEWFCNIVLNAYIQKNNLAELRLLNAERKINIILQLPNGSALLQTNYPVDEIWAMHQKDSNAELEIKEGLVNFIVWKNEQQIKIDRLTVEQFWFLDKVSKPLAFADVCEEFCHIYPDDNINVVFADSIQHGWVRSFTA